MHFTTSSYVSEHYGVTHVKILSLLTKVKESVNRERERGDKALGAGELYTLKLAIIKALKTLHRLMV